MKRFKEIVLFYMGGFGAGLLIAAIVEYPPTANAKYVMCFGGGMFLSWIITILVERLADE